MKKIMFGVVIGISLALSLKSAVAQFTATELPAIPAKDSRNLVENYTMTEGQTLTLSATGRTTRTITVPSDKTAKVMVRIFINIQ